jgi:putative ABC transport system substrate-binding protein
VVALAGSVAALSLPVQAQRMEGSPRIGYLDQGPSARNHKYVDALLQGLHDLGWKREDIAIEARFAEGKTDQLPALAAELVHAKVDVIATWSTPAALAAKRATATIPIVIGFTADPVGSGIVASLARPGANITGWTHLGLELRAKYLELLKDAVPDAARFGVLWNPNNQVHKPSLDTIEAAARTLHVEVYPAGVPRASEFEGTYAALLDKGAQALIVFPDGMFVAQMPTILSLSSRHRLPTMYGLREYVEAGGLMAYGADLTAMERRIGASFVDRILKGAKPGDLPVAQPTKFELLINVKTARALGLTLPESLMMRADQVI